MKKIAKNKLLKQKIKKLLSYDDIMMELQLDYDGITDGTTMAQASTLVPVTKMKKAQAWTLALSWGAQNSEHKKARIRRRTLS